MRCATDTRRATGNCSRQTAHAVLTALVSAGGAEAVGAGRGADYVPAELRSYRWDVADLEEHRAWIDPLRDEAMETIQDPARSVLEYAVTEMVNNVIDHSGSGDLVTLSGRAIRAVDRVPDDVRAILREHGITADIRIVPATIDEMMASPTTYPQASGVQNGKMMPERTPDS